MKTFVSTVRLFRLFRLETKGVCFVNIVYFVCTFVSFISLRKEKDVCYGFVYFDYTFISLVSYEPQSHSGCKSTVYVSMPGSTE